MVKLALTISFRLKSFLFCSWETCKLIKLYEHDLTWSNLIPNSILICVLLTNNVYFQHKVTKTIQLFRWCSSTDQWVSDLLPHPGKQYFIIMIISTCCNDYTCSYSQMGSSLAYGDNSCPHCGASTTVRFTWAQSQCSVCCPYFEIYLPRPYIEVMCVSMINCDLLGNSQ